MSNTATVPSQKGQPDLVSALEDLGVKAAETSAFEKIRTGLLRSPEFAVFGPMLADSRMNPDVSGFFSEGIPIGWAKTDEGLNIIPNSFVPFSRQGGMKANTVSSWTRPPNGLVDGRGYEPLFLKFERAKGNGNPDPVHVAVRFNSFHQEVPLNTVAEIDPGKFIEGATKSLVWLATTYGRNLFKDPLVDRDFRERFVSQARIVGRKLAEVSD